MIRTSYIFRWVSCILLVVFLIVLGFLYVKKEAREREHAERLQHCTESGGETTSTDPYCICPDIFPVLDTGGHFCHDRFGARVFRREEFIIMKDRFVFANDCRSAGNEVYVLGGTPLTMCYMPSWGNPVITKDKKADAYRIAFVSSTPRGAIETVVWWYGRGGTLPVISGFVPTCFDCLTTSTPEVELITQLGLQRKGRLVAGALGERAAFKAVDNIINRSLIVVPKIYEEWYLAVVASNGYVQDVENGIKKVWFDEDIF